MQEPKRKVKPGLERRVRELQSALRELTHARETEGGRRGAAVKRAEDDVTRAKSAFKRQTDVARPRGEAGKKPGELRREEEVVAASNYAEQKDHRHGSVREYIEEGPETSLAHDRERNKANEGLRSAMRALDRQRAARKKREESNAQER